jgi:hypothetical protein
VNVSALDVDPPGPLLEHRPGEAAKVAEMT